MVPVNSSATAGFETKFPNVKTLSWDTLRTLPFTPRQPIIAPILNERQVGMIYAPAGVGKTWFTLSLAVVAASGHGASFLGFHNDGRGMKVFLIDGEMDTEDLKNRLDLIVKAVGANEEAVRSNLEIASRQHQPYDGAFPDIADEQWQNDILRYCRKQGVGLLVLDNFSTLATSIDDENSAANVGKVNSMLLKAKAASVGCLLVHHANKGTGSYRGSSAIAVTLDLIISLARPENYTNVDGETAFSLVFEKVRGLIPREITNPRTVVLHSENGSGSWKVDEHPATQGQFLRQHLESLRFTTQRELAAHLHITEGALSKQIKTAIAARVFSRGEVGMWLSQALDVRKASELSEDDAQQDQEQHGGHPFEDMTEDEEVSEPTNF